MNPAWKSMLKIVPCLAFAMLGATDLGHSEGEDLDLKSTSSALASEAWGALERLDYPAARVAIMRCETLYGPQAEEMQNSLTALPDKETANRYWALNDVGTCIFILGKVAEAEGKKDEALACYKKVTEKFGYSQCWDNGGWYWQPAVAAKERIAAITLDSE
jgi:tetratricopeptide (TPR) repeat protein